MPKKLKEPLTALLLAEELIDATLSGKKFVTVREGHRNYKPGRVIFACPEVEWSMMKEITNVKHTTPKKCDKRDYLDEGWVSREDMVEDLKRFYPNLTMDSPITVIRFK
jgi:hypothetical protein